MSLILPRPRATIALWLALTAMLVGAASAQARVSLKGSKRGYTLVVPGNEVLQGKITLTLPERAARHNRLVPYAITCKAGNTDPQELIRFAAMSNGTRTLRGIAQSIGLVPGDTCTVKRRSKRIRRITLH